MVLKPSSPTHPAKWLIECFKILKEQSENINFNLNHILQIQNNIILSFLADLDQTSHNKNYNQPSPNFNPSAIVTSSHRTITTQISRMPSLLLDHSNFFIIQTSLRLMPFTIPVRKINPKSLRQPQKALHNLPNESKRQK